MTTTLEQEPLVTRASRAPAIGLALAAILVAGGAADFLDWATSVALERLAVFGLVPGSWTRGIASRIPTGCRVIVRAHQNPIASRYAHRVHEALASRCEVIVRAAQ